VAEQRLYRTEAIVLRHARSGEAGRVLTILTPGYGKLRVVVKGVLRPTSHMAGHLELFARSRLLLAHARGMDIITQAELVDSHPGLRDSLEKTTAAAYAAELVDRMTEEQHESRELYNLLAMTMAWIAAAPEPELPLRYLEMRMLDDSGYQPELQRCQACKRPLVPELNGFSPVAGGTLCSHCVGNYSDTRPLSLNALKVLRLLQADDLSPLRRVKLPPALHRELETLLRAYLVHVTEQQMRSVSFLETVRSTPAAAPATVETP